MRVLSLLFWLVVVGRTAAAATAVWIDTDPSIGAPWREVDDAFALVLAFYSPELRIAGISTTYGNAGLPRTTAVARDLVQRFGMDAKLSRDDVHAGARSAGGAVSRTHAAEALARALRKEKLTYLALGPLTNLAAFLRLHPELAQRIDRVIFIGGRSPEYTPAFGPGGSFRIHDGNVFKDPAAVKMVLQSRIPITLAPIEVSPQMTLTDNDLRQLRGSGAAGDFLSRESRAWLWFWTAIMREKGGLVFDALAVLPVIDPGFLETEMRFAHVDGHGELIAERSARNTNRKVRFATSVKTRVKAVVLQRLQRRP